MEKGNLCCLVTKGPGFAKWTLLKIDEVPNLPEIDLENQQWKDKKWGWRKIGEESGTGSVRFIFDWTNFGHIKKALEVTADFHR